MGELHNIDQVDVALTALHAAHVVSVETDYFSRLPNVDTTSGPR